MAKLNAIGGTALRVAALRAAETRRPDHLVADPHAERFLAAAGDSTGGSGQHGLGDEFVAVMSQQVAVRTRFLDDALLAATAAGCRQVVLVASGVDSRAHRLAWPAGVELFDLDQPAVLEFKDQVLDPASARCTRHPVGVDLRTDWPVPLRAAGFRPERPTAWLTEGLLYALDPAAADGLLTTIGGLSAAGSIIAFDHIQTSQRLREMLRATDPALVQLWRGGPADPAEWLTRHGWTAEITELADLARHHGRTVHPAYDPAAGGAHSWLATGTWQVPSPT
ncbi:SAM-dependent methyltransferase [Actinophytocola sediminis]